EETLSENRSEVEKRRRGRYNSKGKKPFLRINAANKEVEKKKVSKKKKNT
ncbi:21729_t:CDS:2, partial [Gigaspora margarita]